MALRSKRSGQLGEISQASLSDIAFLLLVFFIATTIFPTERGIPLVLPGSTSITKQINRKNVLQITSDAQGRIFVNSEPFTIRELKKRVEEGIEENPDLVVSIETHPDAPYGVMVHVLDEVKMARADRISIKLFRG